MKSDTNPKATPEALKTCFHGTKEKWSMHILARQDFLPGAPSFNTLPSYGKKYQLTGVDCQAMQRVAESVSDIATSAPREQAQMTPAHVADHAHRAQANQTTAAMPAVMRQAGSPNANKPGADACVTPSCSPRTLAACMMAANDATPGSSKPPQSKCTPVDDILAASAEHPPESSPVPDTSGSLPSHAGSEVIEISTADDGATENASPAPSATQRTREDTPEPSPRTDIQFAQSTAAEHGYAAAATHAVALADMALQSEDPAATDSAGANAHATRSPQDASQSCSPAALPPPPQRPLSNIGNNLLHVITAAANAPLPSLARRPALRSDAKLTRKAQARPGLSPAQAVASPPRQPEGAVVPTTARPAAPERKVSEHTHDGATTPLQDRPAAMSGRLPDTYPPPSIQAAPSPAALVPVSREAWRASAEGQPSPAQLMEAQPIESQLPLTPPSPEQPSDPQPAELQVAACDSREFQTEELQHVEAPPTDVQLADFQATELQLTELQPTELIGVELQPTEMQPTELMQVEPQPETLQLTQLQPTQTQPKPVLTAGAHNTQSPQPCQPGRTAGAAASAPPGLPHPEPRPCHQNIEPGPPEGAREQLQPPRPQSMAARPPADAAHAHVSAVARPRRQTCDRAVQTTPEPDAAPRPRLAASALAPAGAPPGHPELRQRRRLSAPTPAGTPAKRLRSAPASAPPPILRPAPPQSPAASPPQRSPVLLSRLPAAVASPTAQPRHDVEPASARRARHSGGARRWPRSAPAAGDAHPPRPHHLPVGTARVPLQAVPGHVAAAGCVGEGRSACVAQPGRPRRSAGDAAAGAHQLACFPGRDMSVLAVRAALLRGEVPASPRMV